MSHSGNLDPHLVRALVVACAVATAGGCASRDAMVGDDSIADAAAAAPGTDSAVPPDAPSAWLRVVDANVENLCSGGDKDGEPCKRDWKDLIKFLAQLDSAPDILTIQQVDSDSIVLLMTALEAKTGRRYSYVKTSGSDDLGACDGHKKTQQNAVIWRERFTLVTQIEKRAKRHKVGGAACEAYQPGGPEGGQFRTVAQYVVLEDTATSPMKRLTVSSNHYPSNDEGGDGCEDDNALRTALQMDELGASDLFLVGGDFNSQAGGGDAGTIESIFSERGYESACDWQTSATSPCGDNWTGHTTRNKIDFLLVKGASRPPTNSRTVTFEEADAANPDTISSTTIVGTYSDHRAIVTDVWY